MWIFGYGSLLWYQDFPFSEKVNGYVKGYSRKFWQKSPDHRGTPEKPGRTVTLVHESEGICWGSAYKVPEEHVVSTKAYLDHREKAGYECVNVSFYPDDKDRKPFEVYVYMNMDDNEHHAGPSENEEIAQTILYSHGPSGPNIEYLLRLAKILRSEASHLPDEHVFDLEERVIELSKKTGHGRDILLKLGYV